MRHLLALIIVIVGASAVAAQTSATPESRVAVALIADIRARLGPAASVSVTNVVLTLRDDATGSLAIALAPSALLASPVAFAVIGAGSNGRPAQVGRGRADLHVSVPHARMARTITRGSVLTPDDLVDSTGNAGAVPLRRLPIARELVGGAMRRDAVSGEVLTLRSAVLPPAVRAGDTVQAVASVGGVQVTAALTVMDNGAAGALVRVVNRDTRRELRARVLRPGVVEVIHE